MKLFSSEILLKLAIADDSAVVDDDERILLFLQNIINGRYYLEWTRHKKLIMKLIN